MALDIITSINLDMKAPNAEVVYGNQYDSAGHVVAQLLNDGEKWMVPSGARAVISYRKSDRIGGYYDTTEFGENAVAISTDRSIITIALDQQTLTTFGPVYVQINFLQDNQRLSTFEFLLQVRKSPIVRTNIESKWFVKLMSLSGIVVDDTLSILGNAADAKKTGDKIAEVTSNLNAEVRRAIAAENAEIERAVRVENLKVNKPISSPNGTNGQLLQTNGDGTTQWTTQGTPSDDQVGTAVSAWLDNHPEATTTVQDGAITRPKFAQDIKEIIDDSEYLLHETKVAFLHQEDSECVSPENGYSSCTVIWDEDTCIIYDFGYDTSKKLISFLVVNSITKVDAVIVSHYHSDHCSLASVQAFISGCTLNSINLSNCVFYLPHHGIDWSEFSDQGFGTVETNVKNEITQNGMTYVEPMVEGEKYTIGGIDVEFTNITPAWYDDYYDWKYNEVNQVKTIPNYNNFSMCAMFYLAGNKLYLTGDIMLPAQEKLCEIVKSADCIMVPHHGLNCRESDKFIKNMNCKIGVVPGFWAERYAVVKHGLRPIAARCRELGALESTLSSDVIVSFNDAGVHLISNSTYACIGKELGQMLFDDEDLNNVGYGVYYSQSAARSENIANYPTGLGTRFGGAKIYTFPSSATSTDTSGRVQLAVATYDQNARISFRKFESGVWSSWRPLNGCRIAKNSNLEFTVYGIVTEDRRDLILIAPFGINYLSTTSVKNIVSTVTAGIRRSYDGITDPPNGGYIVQTSESIIEYLATAEIQSAGRGLYLRFRKNDEPRWGSLNNIPVAGKITISFSEDIV